MQATTEKRNSILLSKISNERNLQQIKIHMEKLSKAETFKKSLTYNLSCLNHLLQSSHYDVEIVSYLNESGGRDALYRLHDEWKLRMSSASPEVDVDGIGGCLDLISRVLDKLDGGNTENQCKSNITRQRSHDNQNVGSDECDSRLGMPNAEADEDLGSKLDAPETPLSAPIRVLPSSPKPSSTTASGVSVAGGKVPMISEHSPPSPAVTSVRSKMKLFSRNPNQQVPVFPATVKGTGARAVGPPGRAPEPPRSEAAGAGSSKASTAQGPSVVRGTASSRPSRANASSSTSSSDVYKRSAVSTSTSTSLAAKSGLTKSGSNGSLSSLGSATSTTPSASQSHSRPPSEVKARYIAATSATVPSEAKGAHTHTRPSTLQVQVASKLSSPRTPLLWRTSSHASGLKNPANNVNVTSTTTTSESEGSRTPPNDATPTTPISSDSPGLAQKQLLGKSQSVATGLKYPVNNVMGTSTSFSGESNRLQTPVTTTIIPSAAGGSNKGSGVGRTTNVARKLISHHPTVILSAMDPHPHPQPVVRSLRGGRSAAAPPADSNTDTDTHASSLIPDSSQPLVSGADTSLTAPVAGSGAAAVSVPRPVLRVMGGGPSWAADSARIRRTLRGGGGTSNKPADKDEVKEKEKDATLISVDS